MASSTQSVSNIFLLSLTTEDDTAAGGHSSSRELTLHSRSPFDAALSHISFSEYAAPKNSAGASSPSGPIRVSLVVEMSTHEEKDTKSASKKKASLPSASAITVASAVFPSDAERDAEEVQHSKEGEEVALSSSTCVLRHPLVFHSATAPPPSASPSSIPTRLRLHVESTSTSGSGMVPYTGSRQFRVVLSGLQQTTLTTAQWNLLREAPALTPAAGAGGQPKAGERKRRRG